MKPRLAAILLLLVCLPLCLLAWLGYDRARGEQARVETRLHQLLTNSLSDARQKMSAGVKTAESQLGGLLDFSPLAVDVEALRNRARQHRLVRQLFAVSNEGELVYPALEPSAQSTAERAFISRLGQQIHMLGHLESDRGEEGSPLPQMGWHQWYHDTGLHLLLWNRLSSGALIGLEVDRMAFLADLIDTLPVDFGSQRVREGGRIVLRNEGQQPVYQWGGFEPPADSKPAVTLAAPAPFQSWSFAYYVPPGVGGTTSKVSGETFTLTAAIIAIGLLLIGLGAYFYWENNKAFREASQRVNFVSQVSHELKTPLTNIRMYAELAGNRLTDEETDARACLDVVVNESGRLSRLIQNVLTFARHQRGGATGLQAGSTRIDDTIRSTLDGFRPALEEAGVAVSLDLQASEPRLLDGDAVEQILGNLIGNVLKYASEGLFLGIKTRLDGEQVSVEIADHGPGLPARARKKVFQPFYRLNDHITEGVSGTGIGLTIARRLAREHGGDLSLGRSERGARFVLTIRALETA